MTWLRINEYIDVRAKTDSKRVVSLRYRHNRVSSMHYAGKKALKFKNPVADKFSMEDMGLITVSVATADLTREYTAKKGWIPENLNV